MSAIIEPLARTAVNMLPGIEANAERQQAQVERGRQLMKDVTMGGIALGGGVGLGVALLKYLRSIREEADAQDPARLNDDTLYVPVKGAQQEKEAAMEHWLAPGLAATGGVLGAGAAYAVVRAVAEKLERKRRLRMLDEAQQETLAAVEAETEKAANAQLSVADILTATPVAIPLLAALAAGGVSYAALNKAFPTIKRKKLDGPKKIKFVDAQGTVVDTEDVQKVASELLLTLVDAAAQEKLANHCVTTDILNFVAQFGKQASVLFEDSSDFFSDVASAPAASFSDKVAAARLIQDDPRLSATANAVAAAEFADLLPGIFKAAGQFDDKALRHATVISALFYLDDSRPHIKNASQNLREQIEDRDAALTSDVTGSAGEDMEVTDAGDGGATNDDVVDQIISDIRNSPIAPQ